MRSTAGFCIFSWEGGKLGEDSGLQNSSLKPDVDEKTSMAVSLSSTAGVSLRGRSSKIFAGLLIFFRRRCLGGASLGWWGSSVGAFLDTITFSCWAERPGLKSYHLAGFGRQFSGGLGLSEPLTSFAPHALSTAFFLSAACYVSACWSAMESLQSQEVTW